MTDERESTDTAATLVRRLEAEAELVDDGRFTLDFAAAREKLGNYRQADPHAFVLLLVEAAHLLAGCSQIVFWIAEQQTRVMLVGARASAQELRTLFEAAFVGGATLEPDARAHALGRQRLALAIDAVLAQAGATVELLGPPVDQREIVVRFGPTGQTVEERASVAPVSISLTFVMPEASEDAAAKQRALLETRARYSRLPLHVDEQRIDRADAMKDVAAPIDVVTAAGVCVGRAGWSLARTEGTAILVAHGVIVEELHEGGWQQGFVALVDVADLRRDLSLTKLIRDDAFAARVEAIRTAHDALPVNPTTVVLHAYIERDRNASWRPLLSGVAMMVVGILPMLFHPLMVLATFILIYAGGEIAWSSLQDWREEIGRRSALRGVGVVESVSARPDPRSPWVLSLRVSIADREPFVASVTCSTKPEIEGEAFSTGQCFHVRVDRKDPSRVWFDEVRVED